MNSKQSVDPAVVADFFESIAAHMRENRSIFLGAGRELTAAESRVVVREARGLARSYRQQAETG